MLKTTQYDLVSSFMIAIVVALVIAVVWLFVLWLANRPIQPEHLAEMELIELGGYEDGAPDETLRVEAPEDVVDDPSVVEADDNLDTEVIDNVLEQSKNAAQQAMTEIRTTEEGGGKIGRADGSGRRPLGTGGGEGGVPRHQRWFVRFQDRGTPNEYARQLDFFGIKLALWKDGRIHVLSRMSQAQPNVEVRTKGDQDQFYFTWQGGGRKQADVDLFKKAGINPTGGIILHFYPPETVNSLAELEKDRSNRPVQQIRRTYFSVRRGTDRGYEFVVTKITYF